MSDTNSKHTPGPWKYNDPEKFKQVVGRFSDVAVYAPGNAFPWRMAEVQGPDEETTIANARLLAAAPDLLEACIKAREWLDGWASADPYIGVLEAAIAKATGSES